ncbi:MAG: hypothetical protein ACOVLL_05965, partial [Hydrogenophaga sp.]
VPAAISRASYYDTEFCVWSNYFRVCTDFFLTLRCLSASAFAACVVNSEALQYTTDFEPESNV